MTLVELNTNVVSYVALLRTRGVPLLRDLTHRFDLEFTISEAIAPVDLDPEDDFHYRWIALGSKALPEQLASFQSHAMRVEALYKRNGDAGPLRITFGYLDPFKVVRATRENSMTGIAIGQGVWAEAVLRKEPGEKFQSRGSSGDIWLNDKAIKFFNSIL